MSCFFIWKVTFPFILCFYYPASKVSIFGVILVQFFRIRNEYREIRSISPYSARMRENANQSNSEYRHFTQCYLSIPVCHHFYVLDFFILFFHFIYQQLMTFINTFYLFCKICAILLRNRTCLWKKQTLSN